MKNYISFLLLISVYAIGLLIFTRGFLLNRAVISTNSTCTPPTINKDSSSSAQTESREKSPETNSNGCWMPRRFNRAVVVVIDALRFDFVAHTDSPFKSLYANRLSSITEALAKHPQHSRLYRFRADAPTTTLQRLKGMTTGSLPTFVDAGSNFASTEITEDNIIDQLMTTWHTDQGAENQVEQSSSDKNSESFDSNATKSLQHSNVRPMTFMGDDTWMSLFPNRFSRFFPYPSFNVKDLHTVDNGVIGRLVPEIGKTNEKGRKDWGLIVAHLLGVDHCGHTYGPNTTAMRDKLDQMNQLIRSVMERVDDDTLLVVMGDHGMTRTGDHGGDSEDEIMSALFLYSKLHPLTSLAANHEDSVGRYQTVSQVDLVPSLSLLLGAPIPFSNLGRVIDELFPDVSHNNSVEFLLNNSYSDSLVSALRVNAYQIKRYIDAYSKLFGTNMRQSEIKRLNVLLVEADLEYDNYKLGQISSRLVHLQHSCDLYRDYMIGVRKMCESMWAQFDLVLMAHGLAICVIALIINITIVYSGASLDSIIISVLNPLDSKNRSSGGKVFFSLLRLIIFTVIFCAGFFLLREYLKLDIFSSAISMCLLIVLLSCSLNLAQVVFKHSGCPRFADIFGVVLWCLYIASLLSNSFVVYEDRSSVFLSQTIVVIIGITSIMQKKDGNKSQDKTSNKSAGMKANEKNDRQGINFSLVAYVIVLLILTRLAAMYHSCREEQIDCDTALPLSQFFLQPLSSLSNQLQTLRIVIATVSLAAVVYAAKSWMSHYGNLNGSTWGAYLMRNVCPVMVVMLGSYWFISSIASAHSSSDSARILSKLVPDWLPLGLAKSVYVLGGVVIVAMLCSPLCVLLYSRSSVQQEEVEPEFIPNPDEDLVPQYYQYLSSHWRQKSKTSTRQRRNNASRAEKAESNEEVPVVFGLATAYSSSHLVVLTTVTIVIAMLLGDGMASSVLVLVGILFVSLELHSMQAASVDVSMLNIISVCFIVSQHFFGVGHQATIPSIRFEAAFHGFRGDFVTFLIPAALITINTFASQILCSGALPLFLYWPLNRGGSDSNSVGDGETREEGVRLRDKGELMLCEEEGVLKRAVYQLHAKYILLTAIKLFGCMVCAIIHRRHLMVWKIFAPRFVYEGASFLVTGITCLLSYGFVLRVHRSLSGWIMDNIYNKSSAS